MKHQRLGTASSDLLRGFPNGWQNWETAPAATTTLLGMHRLHSRQLAGAADNHRADLAQPTLDHLLQGEGDWVAARLLDWVSDAYGDLA